MKPLRPAYRFLSLFLAGLLLLTAVGHSQRERVLVKKVVSAHKATKPGKTATPKPAEATVSAAQFEAVVTAAASFDFGPMELLIPAPAVLYLLRLPAPWLPRRQTPHYFFAYFRHVFGHFIAPNAP